MVKCMLVVDLCDKIGMYAQQFALSFMKTPDLKRLSLMDNFKLLYLLVVMVFFIAFDNIYFIDIWLIADVEECCVR